MVETRLIPDIQCKLLGYDCVYVQLDGARAHVKVLKDLNKFAKTHVSASWNRARDAGTIIIFEPRRRARRTR